MQPEPEQVTQFLEAVGAGDPHAAEKLLPLVYEELRRLGSGQNAVVYEPSWGFHNKQLYEQLYAADTKSDTERVKNG